MTDAIANFVYYVQDPPAAARFWAAALGRRVVPYDGEFGDTLRAAGLDDEALARRVFVEDPDGGPLLVFRHTGEPKATRNRFHFDVKAVPGRTATPEELDEARDRLVALGATIVRLLDTQWGPFPEHYYQLLDPEGNEFCLVP